MLEPGTTVGGQYRVERMLGRGGMAEVYEATELSLERTVALKLLAPELAHDERLRERFRREGLMQAAVEHPSIVPVYAACCTDDSALIAMRLIRGTDLKTLILDGSLDTARAVRLLDMVAAALDAAHARSLVHRDVKPHNVLVDETGWAFLADFGLTRASASELTRLTATGQLVGSIDYMAPEQIAGEEPAACGDVYSLACVLFECLTGSLPFAKPTQAAVLFAHISQPPPPVSGHRPDLPAALDSVLARGMAKDPTARHACATELMADAREALGPTLAADGPPGAPGDAYALRPPA
jgi:serine/threonine kinase PknH